MLRTPKGPERNLTIVDACLIEDYLPRILDVVTAAFRPYHPLGLEFARSELNNQLVKLVPGDDAVVVLELLFTFGDDDITIVICYPQEAIVPILASLSDLEREATAEALVRSSPMRRSILRVPIPVTVALPATTISAGDISALKVGDVLQTGIDADTAPMLMIAGRPTLIVRPTVRRNRLACAVVGEPSSSTKGLLS
jgi:flagellar motor switch protein FliM